jgi:hypothetical protein
LINPLNPELNPSAQRCLPTFLLGILIFKGLIARRLYKSFVRLINPLTPELNPSAQRCLPNFLLGISIFEGLTTRRLYKLLLRLLTL